MTPKQLLEKMREAGFEVSLNGSNLLVKEARWIDGELADLIRKHKSELLGLLRGENHA